MGASAASKLHVDNVHGMICFQQRREMHRKVMRPYTGVLSHSLAALQLNPWPTHAWQCIALLMRV